MLQATRTPRVDAASRILIAELDSPAQRARFDKVGPRQAIIELTGMLRIGMLVSHTVLVTDAMLLDGTYFITLGPDRVLRELGASESRYPLVVTGVAPNLRESLQTRLDNPNFLWSLAAVQSGELAPATVRDTWQQWIRYVDDGIIHYVQQTDAVGHLMLGDPPFDHDTDPNLISELKTQPFRSTAWAAIDEHITGTDREQIRDWWNSGYLQMIARNASADWITFEHGTSISAAQRRGEIQLPSRLIEWARTAGSPTVAVAWDSSRHQRERLHAKPSWARMRDLAYTATQTGAASSRRSVLLDSGFKVLIAIVAVLIAAPGVEFSTVDHPLTWIIFLGVIISTIPYDSLAALLGLFKRDNRAALILQRSEPHHG
jgi:hypothetical protein